MGYSCPRCLMMWAASGRLAGTDHLASWRAKLGAMISAAHSTIDIAKPARDIERASTPRPPGYSASPFRRRCSPPPTR